MCSSAETDNVIQKKIGAFIKQKQESDKKKIILKKKRLENFVE